MENLDIKKIVKTPKDQWETIHFLVKAEQQLIDAIHIMQSVLDNQNEIEFHNERMKNFIKQFQHEAVTTG